MCANIPEFQCKPTIAFLIMKPPAILDDRSNAWLLQNAVANGSSVRDDHLGHRGQQPLIQLLHHPFSNVDGGVALSEGNTPQDKSLTAPIFRDKRDHINSGNFISIFTGYGAHVTMVMNRPAI